MSFSVKINFRSTSLYGVVDAGDEVYCISQTDVAAGVGESYVDPLASPRASYSFGWNEPNTDTRDRRTDIGAKFAGCHFNGINLSTWQIKLPSDTYNIKCACGDPNNAASTNKVEFFDGASSRLTINLATSGADKFIAQDGSEYSSSAWAAVAPVPIVVSSGFLTMKVGNNAATATGFITHLEIVSVVSSLTPLVGTGTLTGIAGRMGLGISPLSTRKGT